MHEKMKDFEITPEMRTAIITACSNPRTFTAYQEALAERVYQEALAFFLEVAEAIKTGKIERPEQRRFSRTAAIHLSSDAANGSARLADMLDKSDDISRQALVVKLIFAEEKICEIKESAESLREAKGSAQ